MPILDSPDAGNLRADCRHLYETARHLIRRSSNGVCDFFALSSAIDVVWTLKNVQECLHSRNGLVLNVWSVVYIEEQGWLQPTFSPERPRPTDATTLLTISNFSSGKITSIKCGKYTSRIAACTIFTMNCSTSTPTLSIGNCQRIIFEEVSQVFRTIPIPYHTIPYPCNDITCANCFCNRINDVSNCYVYL